MKHDDALEALCAREIEIARGIVNGCQKLSERSKETYGDCVANFIRWRYASNNASGEITERMVALWLATRGSAGLSVNTYLASVLKWQGLIGHHLRRKDEHIKIALGQLRDWIRKRSALMKPQIDRVLDGLSEEKPIDARDGAMLALGWAGAMRRAEIIGLDWQQPGDGTGYVYADGAAFKIKLSSGEEVLLQEECAPFVRQWLDLWSCHAELQPGEPVFMQVSRVGKITRERITDRTVNDRIKRRFNDGRLSGDSLSIGVLIDALNQIPNEPVWEYLEKLRKRLRYTSVPLMMAAAGRQYES